MHLTNVSSSNESPQVSKGSSDLDKSRVMSMESIPTETSVDSSKDSPHTPSVGDHKQRHTNPGGWSPMRRHSVGVSLDFTFYKENMQLIMN